MKSISIVIPVLNEEKNIAPLYQEVSSVLKKLKLDFEVIFVNDGSTDSTLEEMLKLHKKDSKVKIIDFRKNFGQSAAMRAGFDLASKDLVCYIDGDMQVKFSELPIFLKEIEKGYDCVIGYRSKRKDSFSKNFMSFFASKLRHKLLGTNLHDYGCPFKVFRRECLEDLELYGEMHRYIPPMLRWRGYTSSEVHISHRQRKYGKTKYNLWRIPKGFLDMIVIWFWQKYANRPLHIFGGLGLISIGIGFLLGLVLIVLRLLGRISLVNSSLPMFAGLLFICGVIFFCFGLIADMQMKTYYKVSEKKPFNIKKIWK
ncbi:MAG: glycosyltransferase family 2 protein [Candidatus ainarchaeum sp.]|nr:glycosyltransferase family 2 protein [Candidatus ainarchaeum sp.]